MRYEITPQVSTCLLTISQGQGHICMILPDLDLAEILQEWGQHRNLGESSKEYGLWRCRTANRCWTLRSRRGRAGWSEGIFPQSRAKYFAIRRCNRNHSHSRIPTTRTSGKKRPWHDWCSLTAIRPDGRGRGPPMTPPPQTVSISLDERLRALEADLIGWALRESGGNKSNLNP